MKRSPAFLTGFAICALLGVLDIAGLIGLGMEDAPPAFVTVTAALLGVITLVGAVMLWRGVRGGLSTVVASRVLSALLGVPAFFAPEAPAWAPAAVGIAILLTLIGVGLLIVGARREHLPHTAQPSH
jgi:hypothetical protein